MDGTVLGLTLLSCWIFTSLSGRKCPSGDIMFRSWVSHRMLEAVETRRSQQGGQCSFHYVGAVSNKAHWENSSLGAKFGGLSGPVAMAMGYRIFSGFI